MLHTEKEKKIALSAHDDKRYLMHNMTDTLPWGHYRVVAADEVVEELELPSIVALSLHEADKPEENNQLSAIAVEQSTTQKHISDIQPQLLTLIQLFEDDGSLKRTS